MNICRNFFVAYNQLGLSIPSSEISEEANLIDPLNTLGAIANQTIIQNYEVVENSDNIITYYPSGVFIANKTGTFFISAYANLLRSSEPTGLYRSSIFQIYKVGKKNGLTIYERIGLDGQNSLDSADNTHTSSPSVFLTCGDSFFCTLSQNSGAIEIMNFSRISVKYLGY